MNNTQQFFKKTKDTHALVIGDVMIDRYLEGDVTRISPEAPVPVVNYKNTINRLGGAANVALNIVAMESKVTLCSVIGQDDNATTFLDLLPSRGISAEGIVQSASRKTTVKTRVLAGNQQLLRVDQEDTHALSSEESIALLERLEKILITDCPNVIILQDYNKGVLQATIIEKVIALANQYNIPTATDPKNKNFWAYKGVTLFKPNLREIQAQVPFDVLPQQDSLDKAADYIQTQLNNAISMITLSEHGIYISNGTKSGIYPTTPRHITDVCGAGDTVISVAALGLALGLTPSQLALLSNAAGGQVCEKPGVVPVDKKLLEKELK